MIAVPVARRLRNGPRTGRTAGTASDSDEWWARRRWRAVRHGVRSQRWLSGLSWSVECRATELDCEGAGDADAELVEMRPPKVRRRGSLAEESDED